MIIAANFKACKTRAKTQDYFDTLNSYLRKADDQNDVLVFSPATTFFKTLNGATLGAQNAYPVKNGAFTGETALEQLEEFGIQTLLIGHSERREILGETQSAIAKKYRFFKEQGFKIVYCIGEPLEINQQGSKAVTAYLDEQLQGIDLNYDNVIIAYEPIWAIGTGLTPSNDEIDTILGDLKSKTGKPLLYGGSVKVANIEEILSLSHCDGVLVGSAALEVEDFITMIQTATNIQK